MSGNFFWYELMTSDPEAAQKFYGDVVGWSIQDGQNGYKILTVEGRGTAGLMALPDDVREMGGKPCWNGYIAVDDVEEVVEEIEDEEGKVLREPSEIPGIIRFAVVTDPQGAVFIVAKGLMDAPPELAPGTPGTVGWHELYAIDSEKAFEFYESLFGWTKTQSMDMGPGGVYHMFATGGEAAVGGMMNKPEPMPMPAWLFYFNVPALDAAVERIKDGGGNIILGPMEVPGGMWIVQGLDPQGAHFALVSPKR